MNKLIILLIAFLLQKPSFGQTNVIEYENWQSQNIKGKVKRIKETSFNATMSNSEVVKTNKGWQYSWDYDKEYFFDTEGYLIYKKFIIDSKTINNYSIKLDSKKRIIEIDRKYSTRYYNYDNENNLISSREINKQPQTVISGNETPTTGIISDFKYYYDSKNNLIRKEEYKSNKKFSTETFHYDSRNNMILSEIKLDSYIETHKYDYDLNNQVVKYQWLDSEEGIIEITTLKYHNKTKLSEHWVNYADGEPEGYILYKFEDGNLIELTEADSDGTIDSKEFITYKLDNHGNWTTKIINTDGKFYIVERIIEYY